MQCSLVPPRCEHGVGIGLRHARRCQRQFLHEGEDRPQLAVDESRREVMDQAVDRFRRDAKQFCRRAVAAVAILAGIEGRHIRASLLPLGGRERGRATQDRLGNAGPMRIDFRMGDEHLLGRGIFGQRRKERHLHLLNLRWRQLLNATAISVDASL